LHNIGLYIYIVKYKSGIKYPIFSGKKEEEEFHAYDQNLKTFPSIFFFLKKRLASFPCFENRNGYHDWFMIIH